MFWAGGKVFTHVFRSVFIEIKRFLNLKPQDRVSPRPLDLLGAACAAVRKGSVEYAKKSGTMLAPENKEDGIVAYLNSKAFLERYHSLADFQKDALLHAARAVLPQLSWTESLAQLGRTMANKVASLSSTHRRLGILVSILTTPLVIGLWIGDKMVRPVQWTLNKLLAIILLGIVKRANTSVPFEKFHTSFKTPTEVGSPIGDAIADVLVQIRDILMPNSMSGDRTRQPATETSPVVLSRAMREDIEKASGRLMKEVLLTLDMQPCTDAAAILKAERGESPSIGDHVLEQILKHVPLPGNPAGRNDIIVRCAKDLCAQLYCLVCTERPLALRITRLLLEAVNSSLDPSSACLPTTRPDTKGLVRQVVTAGVQMWSKGEERKRGMTPIESHIAWIQSREVIPKEPKAGEEPPPLRAGVVGRLQSWQKMITRLKTPSGKALPQNSSVIFVYVQNMGKELLGVFSDMGNTLSKLPETVSTATVRSYIDILGPFRSKLEELSRLYVHLLDCVSVACETLDVRAKILDDLRPAKQDDSETDSITLSLQGILKALNKLKTDPENESYINELSMCRKNISDRIVDFTSLLKVETRSSVDIQVHTLTRTLSSFLMSTVTDAVPSIKQYQKAFKSSEYIKKLSPTKDHSCTEELQKAVNAIFNATGDSDSATQADIIGKVNSLSTMPTDDACKALFESIKDRLKRHMEKQKEIVDRVIVNFTEKILSQIELCEDVYKRRSQVRLTTFSGSASTEIDPALLDTIEGTLDTLLSLAGTIRAPYPAHVDPSKIPLVGSIPTQLLEPHAQELVSNIQSLFGSPGMPEALTTVFLRLLLPVWPPH